MNTLPICTNSMIISKPTVSLQCGVFQAYGLENWLINKFINIAMGIDKTIRYEHLNEDEWFKKEGAAIVHNLELTSEVLNLDLFNVIDIIKNMISSGHYLLGTFNAYYIKSSHLCENIHQKLPYLIYGFDEDAHYFHAIGITSSALFEKYTIPFSEYLNSIQKSVDNIDMKFIKINNDYAFKTNCFEIYNSVYDYLNSRNRSDGCVKSGLTKNYTYGLDCYRNILDYLKLTYVSHEYIESQYYLVFLEHHRIMDYRLQHLLNSGIIKNESICRDYRKIFEKAELVYNYCKSYNETQGFNLLGKIFNLVEEIIFEESKALSLFLKELEKFINTKN